MATPRPPEDGNPNDISGYGKSKKYISVSCEKKNFKVPLAANLISLYSSIRQLVNLDPDHQINCRDNETKQLLTLNSEIPPSIIVEKLGTSFQTHYHFHLQLNFKSSKALLSYVVEKIKFRENDLCQYVCDHAQEIKQESKKMLLKDINGKVLNYKDINIQYDKLENNVPLYIVVEGEEVKKGKSEIEIDIAMEKKPSQKNIPDTPYGKEFFGGFGDISTIYPQKVSGEDMSELKSSIEELTRKVDSLSQNKLQTRDTNSIILIEYISAKKNEKDQKLTISWKYKNKGILSKIETCTLYIIWTVEEIEDEDDLEYMSSRSIKKKHKLNSSSNTQEIAIEMPNDWELQDIKQNFTIAITHQNAEKHNVGNKLNYSMGTKDNIEYEGSDLLFELYLNDLESLNKLTELNSHLWNQKN